MKGGSTLRLDLHLGPDRHNPENVLDLFIGDSDAAIGPVR